MPLRLGISTGAFYPDVPNEDVPAIARSLSVADVEVMPQTLGEHAPGFARLLARAARESGVSVHAIHSWQEFHPVLSPYRRRAEESRSFFAQVIDLAVETGAGVIVWHGPKRAEVAEPDAFDRFMHVAGEIAAECATAGIRLGLENVSWCAIATVRHVLAAASALPQVAPPGSLGFVFDPFQAAEAGANPLLVIGAMEQNLVDVHLSDHAAGTAAARHLPPGQGDLPWPAIVRAVAATGYDGPMMVEAPLGPQGAAFADVRAFLSPLIAAATSATDPCLLPPPPGIREGIALFNRGDYYEAHEAIEHEWHAERRPIRRLYQGILQIGVGLHHARAGNHRGSVLLLTDGIDKTAAFLPTCMGIDLTRLVLDAQRCLDRITALGPERLDAFDWSTVPVILEVDLPEHHPSKAP